MSGIGDQLKEFRKRTGLKQSDVARGTGVVRATISAIEKGISEPSPQNKLRIEQFMDINSNFRRNTVVATVADSDKHMDDLTMIIRRDVDSVRWLLFEHLALNEDGKDYVRTTLNGHLALMESIVKRAFERGMGTEIIEDQEGTNV